jgi:GT2 family glycosyltransferase
VTNRSGNESEIDIEYPDLKRMAVAAREYTRKHRREVTHPGVLHWFCVMLPRRIWEEVGELDEGFGLGLFEDDDYTCRVRAAGYETACAEDVFVHHHQSATLSRLPKEEHDALFERNRIYFESKWGPWRRPTARNRGGVK